MRAALRLLVYDKMTNNKARRREVTFLKYKKRIKRWVSNCSYYIKQDGEKIYRPKAIDIIKDRGQLVYKSTSTPCSCSMCAYYKYDRKEFRKETKRLIKEWKKILYKWIIRLKI